MQQEDLAQIEADITEQTKRACAALAALQAVSPPHEGTGHLTQEQRELLLCELREALVCLARAASVLHEQFQHLLPARQKGKGLTTAVEAGRRGGSKVKQLYGSAHYSQLGKKGGTTVKEQFGQEHFAEMGSKGGAVTRARYGLPHFTALGKQGGKKLAEERGPAFFQAIGRKGGHAPRRPKTPDTPNVDS